MSILRDSNPTTYTIFYKDGRVSTGHSYLESCEMFDSRERLGISSVAPSNAYNTQPK